MQYHVLENRGLLWLQGEDMRHFLQGIITNDVEKLTPDKNLYAAILTPQGKFLYDLFLYDWQGGVLLEYYKPKEADITKKLTIYRLRSKVTFTPINDHFVVAAWDGASGTPDPRDARMGARFITKEKPLNTVSAEEYHKRRIGFTIPEMPIDLVSEESFPLPCNLEEINAIDYKKGCYVGQEVTARSKYRGNIRKKIFTVQFEAIAPQAGTAITAEGKTIGTMLSSAGNLGLAQLEIEAAERPIEGLKILPFRNQH